MSSISSRPRVQKITGPVLTSIAATGAVLAARVLDSLLSATRTAKRTRVPVDSTELALQPAAVLSKQFEDNRRRGFEELRQSLPAVEALRTANLQSLAVTPFYLESSAALQPHCQALQQAATLTDARRAADNLAEALEAGHHRLFTDTLTTACQRAATLVGFDRIEVVRLPDQVRVIAEDAAGRVLVTEIAAALGTAPALATEVVGVSDPSCQQILDGFDKALEEQGVRSAPPERKFTGGVCQLAAARRVASRKLKPAPASASPSTPKTRTPAAARTRQLNPGKAATVRSKG